MPWPRGLSVRKAVSKFFTGQPELELDSRVPTRRELSKRFEDIDSVGFYLHVPFCRQICPYCPYNKEPFCSSVARQYLVALRQEMDIYAEIVGKRPVNSIYIGGGTPTTMLNHGLAEVLEHLHATYNVQCEIHMESHLNDLSPENLDTIQSLGVQHLSMGVESLQDRHLQFLGRPYTSAFAKEVVERVMSRGFKCVNVDLMFALPGQTCQEVEQSASSLASLGVHQVAAYPLFRFPYTQMGSQGQSMQLRIGHHLEEKKDAEDSGVDLLLLRL